MSVKQDLPGCAPGFVVVTVDETGVVAAEEAFFSKNFLLTLTALNRLVDVVDVEDCALLETVKQEGRK